MRSDASEPSAASGWGWWPPTKPHGPGSWRRGSVWMFFEINLHLLLEFYHVLKCFNTVLIGFSKCFQCSNGTMVLEKNRRKSKEFCFSTRVPGLPVWKAGTTNHLTFSDCWRKGQTSRDSKSRESTTCIFSDLWELAPTSQKKNRKVDVHLLVKL